MRTVSVDFVGSCAQLLPAGRRKTPQWVEFQGRRSVKDLIESFRIPHTEVKEVKVSGQSVPLSYILQNGDRIEVLDGASPSLQPGEEPGFICDVHLWKLARRLRLLGFSVDFGMNWDDPYLARLASEKDRVLLTRDRGLLIRKQITRGLLIRSTRIHEQVGEVLKRLSIKEHCKPFRRCLLCDCSLEKRESGGPGFHEIEKLIPPRVRARVHEYRFCPCCGHLYWRGDHFKKLEVMVKHYLKSGNT